MKSNLVKNLRSKLCLFLCPLPGAYGSGKRWNALEEILLELVGDGFVPLDLPLYDFSYPRRGGLRVCCAT
jgi:hypothetical protein